MNLIELQAIPNQEVTVQLGGQLFTLLVQLSPSNGTLLTITAGTTALVTSRLAVANTAILMSPDSLQYGNFGWICEDGASYPAYDQFGLTHFLYWWND